jgi:glycosyltransferase involved in cell wall biosynthesis
VPLNILRPHRSEKGADVQVGIYADVDPNIIDGSSIWLLSLAQTLSLDWKRSLFVVLRSRIERSQVLAPLYQIGNVTLIEPPSKGRLELGDAVEALEGLDQAKGLDLIILRGYRICYAAALSERLAGRIWPYMTDIPQRVEDVSPADKEALETIATASANILCQTEELRSFIEATAPGSCGKCLLLPPMVPPVFYSAKVAKDRSSPGPNRRLFYAGKFAPMWGFLETVEQFEIVRREFPDAELHVAGDKIHDPSEDPDFAPRVRAALESTEGLVWHGGVCREELPGLMSGMDIALSVRDRAMDRSLELSTKLLEYGAVGVPVVCNRTQKHEELFGPEYPLFVTEFGQVSNVVRRAFRDGDVWSRAREICGRVAEGFSFARVEASLARSLKVAAGEGGRNERSSVQTRVLVAGHDLKFFREIENYLDKSGCEVRRDVWSSHTENDSAASHNLLQWADVIICEWCLGNAAWYSRAKKRGQVLIVRFHRQEMETRFPERLNAENVDVFVFVSEAYRRMSRSRYGWPEERLVVIPNGVHPEILDRPKMPGAAFNLGLMGYIPQRKRLDRALHILEELRSRDERFSLYVKGKFPRDVEWLWERESERKFFERQFERVYESPLLREAVSFEPFSENVAGWYQKIGFILSTSDSESFHVALANGMTSKAVPVVFPWEGAEELYGSKWLCEGGSPAVRFVEQCLNASQWKQCGEKAREQVVGRYAIDFVLAQWLELIRGVEPG